MVGVRKSYFLSFPRPCLLVITYQIYVIEVGTRQNKHTDTLYLKYSQSDKHYNT